MQRRDYLLLALCKADDGRLSPVQAQKAMFLLAKEAKEHIAKPFYVFSPYNYGPFCAEIYDDLKTMEVEGLIVTERNAGNRWPEYAITATGQSKCADLVRTAGNIVDAYTSNVVFWIKRQSFSGLLQAIYSKYPEYAVNSVFNK